MASSLRAPLFAVSAILLLATAACGEVIVSAPGDSPTPGAGGSTESIVASSSIASGVVTSASSTSGGEGGAGAGGSEVVCVPQPEGSGGFTEPTCEDLAVLAVSHPVLDDAGQLEVGKTAYLHLNLEEIGGVGFNFYPGVLFETTTAGVTVSSNDWFYAILPCQIDQVIAAITVDNNVAPGTVVMITARVAMLNHDCPDAYSITIPLMVH